MSSRLNLIRRADEIQAKLPSPEYALGKGLLQPANNTNSGPRKIMQIIQKEQSIQLCHSEPPLLMTGYENQFGELSSSFIRSDANYIVLGKVYKNSMHYYLLVVDYKNSRLHCYERKSYEHVTENYGYNLDTRYMDSLQPDSNIPEGKIISTSASFDSAMNKCDGVNLTTIYMALGVNTEDPIVLSQSAADKFKSPLFSKIRLTINDNDIPLNLYGDDTNYKSFPDIGENIRNGILCAIRRERKSDEALYCQSVDRLQELMISDSSIIASGKVIDIDVYCNNVDNLGVIYNTQIAKYYTANMKFCKDLCDTVDKFLKSHKGIKMTYDMNKLYTICRKTLDGVPYWNDKVFNNIVIEMVIKEEKPLYKGDKITDRYGGKGVISKILPDEMMPYYRRGDQYYPVDAIYNVCTIINRENPGQSFETEITFIGEKIVERIADIRASSINEEGLASDSFVVEAEKMIYKYLSIIAPVEAQDYMEDIIKKKPMDERRGYIESVISTGGIYVVSKPISGGINLDRLRDLYHAFPWIQADDIYVLQKDSTGNYRRIAARRKMVTGKKYIYRLKQIGEEKFSAVSLASTNLRGENTKTKANKQHRTAYANTPVKLGSMEIGNQLDDKFIDEALVEALMLLSTSPVARRLNEQLLTGDPFNIDIKLDKNAKSRAVEINNAYLKVMGLRLVFKKVIKKKQQPVLLSVVEKFPGEEEPQSDGLNHVVQGVPYYLNPDNLKELGEKYRTLHKDKMLMSVVNIIPEGMEHPERYTIDAQLETAQQRVLELAMRAENIAELEKAIEKDDMGEKKLLSIVSFMPVTQLGGADEDDGEDKKDIIIS